MKKLNYLRASLLVLPLLMISGCGDDPENEGNHLPTVSILDKEQTVNAGEEVTISAKAFDVDGDALTYLWRITSKPSGSEAQLRNSRTKQVSLVTDKDGNYVLSFIANDGLTDSKTVTATVHASGGDPVVPDETADDGKNNNSDVVVSGTGIVGAWTIDRPKAEKVVASYDENDPTGLFVGLIIAGMKDIEFQEGGTCTLAGMTNHNNNQKCWEAKGDEFIFFGDNGKQSATIEVSDTLLTIKFDEDANSKAIELEYARVSEASLVPPSVVMKKDRVYHAKDINSKEFSGLSDAFLLFTEENRYYWMITKDSASFTASELKAIMNEEDMSKRSELVGGNYTALRGDGYHVRNNTFYTVLGDKKIEIITQEHIKYDGVDYYLE